MTWHGFFPCYKQNLKGVFRFPSSNPLGTIISWMCIWNWIGSTLRFLDPEIFSGSGGQKYVRNQPYKKGIYPLKRNGWFTWKYVPWKRGNIYKPPIFLVFPFQFPGYWQTLPPPTLFCWQFFSKKNDCEDDLHKEIKTKHDCFPWNW